MKSLADPRTAFTYTGQRVFIAGTQNTDIMIPELTTLETD